MRRILVDYARARGARKRGNRWALVSFDEALLSSARAPELTALDEALTRLATLDARQAKIAELRFFSGMSEDESAEVLGISSRAVERDWRIARPGHSKS